MLPGASNCLTMDIFTPSRWSPRGAPAMAAIKKKLSAKDVRGAKEKS